MLLSELTDIPADREVPRFGLLAVSSIDFRVVFCMESVTSRLNDRGETRGGCCCFVFVDSVRLFVLSDRTGVGFLRPDELAGFGGTSGVREGVGVGAPDCGGLLLEAMRGIEDFMPVMLLLTPDVAVLTEDECTLGLGMPVGIRLVFKTALLASEDCEVSNSAPVTSLHI